MTLARRSAASGGRRGRLGLTVCLTVFAIGIIAAVAAGIPRGPAAGVLSPSTAASSGNVLQGQSLYVAADTPAAALVSQYPALAAVASEPTASWLTDTASVASLNRSLTAANASGRLATYVLYAIPHRDCGSFSAGGFATGVEYRAFIDQIAKTVGDRSAIMIVEPDALPQLAVCGLTEAQQAERVSLIRYAVQALGSPQVHVYLDGGGAYSNPAAVIAPRLIAAGIDYAAGFALNISAFDTTDSELRYGRALSGLVAGKHFVIDTSRNGVGVPPSTPEGAFCNVTGLALGTAPTTDTGESLADAYLWIKYPGESDGDCAPGEPGSGVFWPE
jgi:endoglucanase